MQVSDTLRGVVRTIWKTKRRGRTNSSNSGIRISSGFYWKCGILSSVDTIAPLRTRNEPRTRPYHISVVFANRDKKRKKKKEKVRPYFSDGLWVLIEVEPEGVLQVPDSSGLVLLVGFS